MGTAAPLQASNSILEQSANATTNAAAAPAEPVLSYGTNAAMAIAAAKKPADDSATATRSRWPNEALLRARASVIALGLSRVSIVRGPVTGTGHFRLNGSR